MSHVQTLVRIVLPQTLLTTASASISRLTAIVKSSTLVSVITVPNLIFQSQRIVNRYYGPLEILTATAAVYIAIISTVSWFGNVVVGLIRRRLGQAY